MAYVFWKIYLVRFMSEKAWYKIKRQIPNFAYKQHNQ